MLFMNNMINLVTNRYRNSKVCSGPGDESTYSDTCSFVSLPSSTDKFTLPFTCSAANNAPKTKDMKKNTALVRLRMLTIDIL